MQPPPQQQHACCACSQYTTAANTQQQRRQRQRQRALPLHTSIDSSLASSTNPHVLMTMASACATAAMAGGLSKRPGSPACRSQTGRSARRSAGGASPAAAQAGHQAGRPHLLLRIRDLKAGAEQVSQQHLAVHRVLGAAQAAHATRGGGRGRGQQRKAAPPAPPPPPVPTHAPDHRDAQRLDFLLCCLGSVGSGRTGREPGSGPAGGALGRRGGREGPGRCCSTLHDARTSG